MNNSPFSIKETWLECIGCKTKADLLTERNFRCPQCGDLFEVRHDIDGFLKRHNLNRQWLITTFERRVSEFNFSTPLWMMSGVWRFKELIMPFLPPDYIVSLGEGNVPIIRAGRNLSVWIGGGLDLWLMLQGGHPTGSFKDFGGTVVTSVAKAAGVQAVACASTGDTSAMASAYAAAADMKCAVILPRGKVTAVQLAQPLVHGAKVITLPGNFDDCMRVMQELVAKYGVYPVNSLNPSRIEGHQATVFQLAQFFNWELPDWIAVPVGNGSNCSSVGKGMRLLKELDLVHKGSQILGCQSRAANPLARFWEGHVITGGVQQVRDQLLSWWQEAYEPIKVGETTATAARIGDPVSYKKVMREIIGSDGAMAVAEERALNEAVGVCGKDGIFVCPQTGIALAGLKEAVQRGFVPRGDRVVVVSTATGLKFADSAAQGLEKEIIDAPNCSTDTVAKLMGL